MRLHYDHHGWIGSGVCLLTDGPLGVWTETYSAPRLHSARIPATSRLFVCVPCGYALTTLPVGVCAILADGQPTDWTIDPHAKGTH